MHGEGIRRDPPAEVADGAVWRQTRSLDAVENEAERFLDLAAFADGVLDPDERERIVEWLADNAPAAEDIAAARALASMERLPVVPETVVARARALVEPGTAGAGKIVPFRLRLRPAPDFNLAACWAGLAAAMVVVGWIGFNLGMDASLSVGQLTRASDEGFLQELVDPSTGFIHETNSGAST